MAEQPEQGILIRFAARDVRETGRNAMGVRLIDLEPGDRVVAVAKLAEREDEGDEPAPPDGVGAETSGDGGE